jgi:hypothetical protein
MDGSSLFSKGGETYKSSIYLPYFTHSITRRAHFYFTGSFGRVEISAALALNP